MPSQTSIYHISDIHIHRANHARIRYAWKEFLTSVEADLNTKFIFITGDIFEDKVKVYSEDLKLFREMCSSIDDSIQCIIIPGNHDIYNGIDILSNVIDNKPLNIHLLVDSSTIINEVMAITHFDTKTLPNCELQSNMYNIALIHKTITEEDIKLLSKYDLALCGDLHEHQVLGDKQNITYAGSFVQKNRGENLMHGYTVFKLPSKYIKNIPIKWLNDTSILGDCISATNVLLTAYNCDVTFYINDTTYGDMLLDDKIVSSNVNILEPRSVILKYFNYNKLIIDKLTEMYNISAVVSMDKNIMVYDNDINKHIVDNKLSDKLIDLNEQYKIFDANRTIWNLKFIKWRNVFKYIGDNWINFEDIKGSACIVGPNAVGKSSVISIICAVLFYNSNDGVATQRKLLLNNNTQEDGYISILFSILDVEYIINYTINAQNSKYDKLTMYENNIIIEDGDKRMVRDKIVRMLGNKSDFLNIPVALQHRQSILDMVPKMQTEYIRSILGITSISDKVVANDENIKITKKVLNELSKNIPAVNYEELEEVNNMILQTTTDIENLTEYLDDMRVKYALLNSIPVVKECSSCIVPKLLSDKPLEYYTTLKDKYLKILKVYNYIIGKITIIDDLTIIDELPIIDESLVETYYSQLLEASIILESIPNCDVVNIVVPEQSIDELNKMMLSLEKQQYNSDYYLALMDKSVETNMLEHTLKEKQMELITELDNCKAGPLDSLEWELSTIRKSFITNNFGDICDQNVIVINKMLSSIVINKVPYSDKCECPSISIAEINDSILAINKRKEELINALNNDVSINEITRLSKFRKEAAILRATYPDITINLDILNDDYYISEATKCNDIINNRKNADTEIKSLDEQLVKMNSLLLAHDKYTNYLLYDKYVKAIEDQTIIKDYLRYRELILAIDKSKAARVLEDNIYKIQMQLKYLLFREQYNKALEYENMIEYIKLQLDLWKQYEIYNKYIEHKKVRELAQLKYDTNIDLLRGIFALCNVNHCIILLDKYINNILEHEKATVENQNAILYKQYLDNKNEMLILDRNIKDTQARIKEYDNKLIILNQKLSKINSLVDANKQISESKTEYIDKLALLLEYSNMMNDMLNKATNNRLEDFNKLWCSNLSKISNMVVRITLDKGFNIDFKDDNKYLSIDVASGYQKFILDLTFRDTAMELAFISMPNIMIIDEGFGTADIYNREGLKEYITHLSKKTKVLVISHIEEIHTVSNHIIQVQPGSKLQFGKNILEHNVTATKSIEPVMEDDLYCKCCKITLSTKKLAEKHLLSKTHLTKYERYIV